MLFSHHSIVGVSALVLELGAAPYFELIASIAPIAAPMTRVALAGETAGDPCEYRVAGMMDPAQGRIALPEIVLSGA
jgi:hypothetical protein